MDIYQLIQELRNKSGESAKKIKPLKLDRLERVFKRLEVYSNECKDCMEKTEVLNDYVLELHKNLDDIGKDYIKKYQSAVFEAISHLEKAHKLVREGHYVGTYMPIGMSIGLVLGMTVWDNMSLGLSIGLVIGVAIGSSMDSSAKKKGIVI